MVIAPYCHMAKGGSCPEPACRAGITGDITGSIGIEAVVSNTPQRRALDNYRRRLGERGMARFEVLGRDADRELIRSLARRLAQDDPEATRLRAELRRSIAGEPRRRGGILAALRRSPLVSADLDFEREITPGRDVDL